MKIIKTNGMGDKHKDQAGVKMPTVKNKIKKQVSISEDTRVEKKDPLSPVLQRVDAKAKRAQRKFGKSSSQESDIIVRKMLANQNQGGSEVSP